jgi:hypothetical protein
MTKDEFQKIKLTVVDMLCGDDLVDKTPRTLLYGAGYYFDHYFTYFDGEDICICGWDSAGDMPTEIHPNTNDCYIPTSCLRPEYCDFAFCQMLLKLGYTLPFTEGCWYGEKQELRTYEH